MFHAEFAPASITNTLLRLQQVAILFSIIIPYWIEYGSLFHRLHALLYLRPTLGNLRLPRNEFFSAPDMHLSGGGANPSRTISAFQTSYTVANRFGAYGRLPFEGNNGGNQHASCALEDVFDTQM
jgi:hypothetical protein